MGKKVVIIGGGIAGMQAAVTLGELGIRSVIVEKEETLGGKLKGWDRLFPTMTPAGEVLEPLRGRVEASGAEILTSKEVDGIEDEGRAVRLVDGSRIESDAVVVASGFDLFPAEIKEEYGYRIYDNVFTTVDVERMFREGGVRTADGREPRTVAFLHCVGSRDEKVEQRHCSRVCCITGVKQAIEVKQQIPSCEVYNFYMDMRMFGPGYEELYRQAQQQYNIHFVRGRISEASQTIDGRIQIKAEDTLVGLPLRMSVDMLVLIVGMKAGASNSRLCRSAGVELYPSGFVRPLDQFSGNVRSGSARIFYAGTVTAPKNIGESINEGIVAAYQAAGAIKD
ncbi:FAD-dependent oxidoreductase [uncultured Alistipes sp.]|uniref:FAD-dependent oxidoreductase n=1 Tax=uncultured Alistipes sp. TaxID=538949 RepID=UPI00260C97BE|nr:FAD-dependent oxidoreductase [uncultured Alistipes sp.]